MAAISIMKIKGLFKQEFDDFPGIDMIFHFTSNLNVIIGPNGAGKTTVIRLTNEVFGPLGKDDDDESAFIFFDKISSSDIIWGTPFTSIEFEIKPSLTNLFEPGISGSIMIEKHMAGTEPQESDYLEFGDGEGTSIRIFGPAHEESMNTNDYDRAIEIFDKLISKVTMHMVPVNRMVRIEESAFEDPRMLGLMGDDEISSLFLDGKGVTLDVIPEVCRKWVIEANECWRNELIGLGSSLLVALDDGGMDTYLPGQLGESDDMIEADDTIIGGKDEFIERAIGIVKRAKEYQRLGVDIRGPENNERSFSISHDASIEPMWDAVNWVYNLAGVIGPGYPADLHAVAVCHLEQSMDTLGEKVKNLSALRLFIDKFFDGKHCKLSVDDGLTIRLNNHNPSYGAPANSTDILPLQHLSSGEKHALIMMMTVLQGNKNSMIMIDEPETSLHIEWQENLLPWLMEGAKIVGSNLLITTHSPHLLNDHKCNILKIPIRDQDTASEEVKGVDIWRKCDECGSILTEQRERSMYCTICDHYLPVIERVWDSPSDVLDDDDDDY